MSTEQNTQKSAPIYLSLVEEVKNAALEMGIPLELTPGTSTGLPENQRFVIFRSTLNGHKVHVPKSATRMGLSDTTVPAPLGTPLSSLTTRKGEVKVNGKVQQVIQSNVDSLLAALMHLGDSDSKLPENKRPPGKAKATVEAPVRTAMDDYEPEAAQDSEDDSEQA
jgi:hypothetical protein